MGSSFAENVMPNAAVIAAGRGPRQSNAGDYIYNVNYAYHLDAALFADFMRGAAIARGMSI